MPRHIRSSFAIVLLFVLLFARPAAAQAPAQGRPDFSPLESIVRQELKDTGVPGASIAVISGGRVVYEKGFGLANAETAALMTPDLLIRLGSTTKMFTALTLTALAEQGAVDLRKPIGTYIKGLHPSIARITSHQLLSHTSGILDEAPMHGSHDETALMKGVLSWGDDRFFTEPGRIYSYSNPGYWLAGAVIEGASGKLFADQVNDSIFAPLGMTRSTFRPTVAMTYPLAQGHDVVDGKPVVVRPFANNAASWPAGSIFSSVQDLSRFVMAFLAGGQLDGQQAIPAGAVAAIAKGAVKIPGGENEYGYGLTLGTYRGLRLVQHGGSRSGYGSTIRMVPDRLVGVIVLGNRSGASLPRSAEAAMEIALRLPATTKPAPSAAMPALTDAELSAYAGVYSQGARTMQIVKREGKLFLKQGARETELRRTGEHRFTQGLFFVTGADGGVEYVHTGGRSWKKRVGT